MHKAVIYVSEAIASFDEARLIELQRECATRNAARGITGFLWFGSGRFLQYVEGAELDIDRVFGSIEADPRHRVLVWTADDGLVRRRFPGWSMRRLRPDDLVEIRLEHLLSEHLLLTRSLDAGDSEWERLSWRLVAAIASLQGELNEFHERSERSRRG